ncbi:hypothetical protein M501DRAFT_520104 [Patellaria atrata CBS 101060]|uniref:Uncharacterized protein n=1 Tax=Patellaria atrata CBS 101060 TaxID=1346257 RepID=A0A9P4S3S1_9PEZI|nr:hypothetical protein M501DRAFT_520104 [Patellaria atrata CBS 101060]
MHFDWQERTDLDACKTVREKMSREEAQLFAKRTHDAVKWARNNLEKAQATQAKSANKHRREPDFGPGDYVFISRKG